MDIFLIPMQAFIIGDMHINLTTRALNATTSATACSDLLLCSYMGWIIQPDYNYINSVD